MEKIQVDFHQKELFLRYFGNNIYAVGGYVRDLLRKQPTEEVDLLILNHTVNQVVDKLQPEGRVDLVGKSFGVIKFTVDGRTYDIALPRIDQAEEAEIRGHKDFRITTDPDLPIEKDLERRDFRCNSIALRLADGIIIDPFQGRKDIQQKILRMTNPETFAEDPLRLLRAARFASILEYSVDQDIYKKAKAIELSSLSMERINDELFRILLRSPRPSVGLQEFFKLGVLHQLFPELYQLTLSVQDAIFHPETDEFGHHTVWPHTIITVDQAARLVRSSALTKQKALALLLAALFHDVGKAQTAEWEHKNGRLVITNKRHDIISEKITKKIFNRMKIFSWNGYELRESVLRLIRCHHRPSELWMNREVITKKAFNRLAADVAGEIDLLIQLDVADRAGRSRKPINDLDKEGRWLLQKFKELNVSRETIQPLIMGRDLIPMGVEPGPEMGKFLKKLYNLQLDGEFEDKQKGLEIAKKLIQKEKR